ncbi:Adaptor protein complex 1 (AP-1), beta subunit [Monocercomonoides exilis]|uniref:Adaptor protein complex 1 (AP-1), beta subunit n=1 Tax=Monocercomonoides exilis TaxID=2049356 RepID=UPI00355A2868|nr:Adaptor protein complex 1 (AP-1), beta subunit [Monocercomonoides exilis]|eukprot:MONOS_11504.1-p1 / transcript=MONOS_11504.1 / gene=MONOS_11504 / organism=Monocercomonoides_exilis_PA203 / gene_product= Adaptor protein complex 1 (AP-1), beta subunit / transcript_product= Adaptor protein complex 1 (AP-1), beta subunit / location=Mono_scaffold00581:15672-18722(+) / protein_length=964 / sequence_SO=supercontig / SO=protein_coding / is_pseudo=false
MSFFNTTKKGEIQELKDGINSTNISKKKSAMQRIIGMMMGGGDVASLLPSVLVNMQTTDLELKKLIYLYLINYSKSEPELALHAVNTFDKDTKSPNPLVRALALRTMGCIRIDQITEYMCEPLHRCLKDEDPYVKKTAVLGVLKMYDINPQLVEDEGFLDTLKELLGDGNPMVVSNCVAALSEIQMAHPDQTIFEITTEIRQKLIAALSQASEWGQVHILDALAVFYNPESTAEAEEVAERVVVHLIHDNSAVVLSSAKVILKMLPLMENKDLIQQMYKKMAPPLVSLLSSPPEVRYVALRNLNLIVQRLPSLLSGEIKVFFSKYNDPIYVKMEKLEIMMLLVNESNVTNVLNELKEYATEVDVDFVRKAVRAMGRCAILLPEAANVCVDALVQLVETSQVNYVIQEAIIVIKDIFRKYPNKYESIIVKLCNKLQSLDEPEAKAAMIWIIGEYADRIEESDKILESYFVETFQDEPPNVQLAILTATVKVFLAIPESQPLLQQVLKLATKKSDNPDLRDRGYIYWRLLSSNKELARSVVRCHKPPIAAQKQLLPKDILNELIPYLGTLSSVFHKVPTSFSAAARVSVPTSSTTASAREAALQQQSVVPGMDSSVAADLMVAQQRATAAAASSSMSAGPSVAGIKASEAIEATDDGDDGDLIDLSAFAIPSSSSASSATPSGGAADGMIDLSILTGGSSAAPAPAPTQSAAPAAGSGIPAIAPGSLAATLTPIIAHSSGVQIKGDFVFREGKPYFGIAIFNASQQAITSAELQFNRNAFGLAPLGISLAPYPFAPQQMREALVPISAQPEMMADPANPAAAPAIEMGLKVDPVGLIFFQQNAKFFCATQVPPLPLDTCKANAMASYNTLPVNKCAIEKSPAPDQCVAILSQYGFVTTNKMERPDLYVIQLYASSSAAFKGEIIADFAFKPTVPGIYSLEAYARTNPEALGKLFVEQLPGILTSA